MFSLFFLYFFFYFYRAAYEAGAATAIVNIGSTRADDFVPLKISARCGEVYSNSDFRLLFYCLKFT